MTSPGFTLRATATFDTKRSPSEAGGKVGAMASNLTDEKCYPPVQLRDPSLLELYATGAWGLVYETFAQGGLDVLEGDILTIDSTDYNVRGVSAFPWPADGEDRLHIVLEEIKTP